MKKNIKNLAVIVALALPIASFAASTAGTQVAGAVAAAQAQSTPSVFVIYNNDPTHAMDVEYEVYEVQGVNGPLKLLGGQTVYVPEQSKVDVNAHPGEGTGTYLLAVRYARVEGAPQYTAYSAPENESQIPCGFNLFSDRYDNLVLLTPLNNTSQVLCSVGTV